MIRLKQLLEQSLKQFNSKATIIFMAGRDWRPGDLSIEEQKRYLLQEIAAPVTVIVHEHDELDAVLASITKHPTAFVVLFDDACYNVKSVANKLYDKRALHIVSPPEFAPPSLGTDISAAVTDGATLHRSPYDIDDIRLIDPMGLSNQFVSDGQIKPIYDLKQAGRRIQYDLDHSDIIQPITEPEKSAVPTININDFRRQWKALGNTIKVIPGQPGPDELSNGGPVDEVLLGIVLELFKEFGEPVKITSGNDTYHHTLSYVSLHAKGKALDIVPNVGRSTTLETLMNKYEKKYSIFAWDNEYTNLARAATGPHYHLYLDGQVTKTPK